jgi:trimethylamine-N-oxide reductase (cytochrome c)
VGDGGAVPPALEPEITKVIHLDHNQITYEVKNGRPVRVRRTTYNEIEPQVIEARGKSLTIPNRSHASPLPLGHRTRLDSPNRILYPMKRVDWEPGGDPAKINAQNRGISKYKRISWDEATDIIASEITRIADTYGTEALASLYSGGHCERKHVAGQHGEQGRFLNWWAMSEYGTAITEGSGAATTFSGGQLGGRYVMGSDYEPIDNYKDVAENCEMLLGWGSDPVTKCWFRGTGLLQSLIVHWFGDLGIHRVFIEPDLNHGAAVNVDKWIPVVPTTDAAMMLAIAHIWITEGTYDQDYLDTHTNGFDLFRNYVMGDEDGIPKTVEWASPICGVTEWTIKALARAWAKKPTTIHYGRAGGGAVGRTVYGFNPQRIQIYLQLMQGLGGPGKHFTRWLQDVGRRAERSANVGAIRPRSKISAAMDAEGIALPPSSERQRFPREYFYEAIFNPPVEWYQTGSQFTKSIYPLPGKSEIHFIWASANSYTGSRQGGFRTQLALQSPKLECIVTQHIWLEDCDVFSDILLPVRTAAEVVDTVTPNDTTDMFTYLEEPVVTPKGEAETDIGCVIEVARKLGWGDKLLEGYSTTDELLLARVKEGYENCGITDLVSQEELREKGYFAQNPDPKWYDQVADYTKFYDDPAGNPRRTPTGLFEFESQLLKENMPDDKERPPLARYVIGGPPEEGWSHNEYPYGSKSETYPLMMVCNTSVWKHHSMYSDVPWLREIEKVIGWDGYAYAPAWIHPEDAEKRGIKDGDIVRVFNDKGGVLGGAVITERVRPGAINFDKAGGGSHIIVGELHQGGNVNCLTPYIPMSRIAYGLACINYLCDVEKVTGDMMDEWRENYPGPFERNRDYYDPATGPNFLGWIEGGK